MSAPVTTRLEEIYAALRDCWTAGGQAAQIAPDGWRPLLTADADEAERRLLALAGQAFEVGLRPALGPHTARPSLPVLASPRVPDRLRPLVRRVLKTEGSPARVVALLARRGYTMHPLDWFPAAGADNRVPAVGSDNRVPAVGPDVPEAYGPWLRWAGGSARPDDGDGTEQDWEYLSCSARRRVLRQLRGTDPAAARALLDERFAAEPAPERLALLEVVAETDLTDDDVPFLESLGTDRSGKVKALSRQLLMRLGRLDGDPDDVAELCGFVTAKRRGIPRTVVVTAAETKTRAQHRRRDQLFGSVSLAGLAGALGITADELVGAWNPESDLAATTAFVGMVGATGTSAQAEHLAGRLVSRAGLADQAAALIPRLGPDARTTMTKALLRRGIGDFHGWCGGMTVELDASVLDSRVFRQCERLTDAPTVAVNTVALLCPADVAAQALVRLRAAGAPPHYLDMFVLSAELPPID